MPEKYVWCIEQILRWMNVQRVVEYFLFLDDVYILVSISLCIFPALALWKDEKIKVLSSTFFEVVICMCTYEVLFSITRTWNPRMKVMQGEKFYIVKGNSREIRAATLHVMKIVFDVWPKCLFTKEIGTQVYYGRIICLFKCIAQGKIS